jgi:hypothetical protein
MDIRLALLLTRPRVEVDLDSVDYYVNNHNS